MAQQVQLRRGTTAQHAAFTGAAGEVTVDTDKGTVVIHNGSTAGGFPALRENGSQNLVTTGTVTGASLSPTSSTVPTNGIYLPDANSVAISTGGSGRVFIGSTGTVNFTGGGTAGSTQAVSFNGSAPVNSLVIDSSGRLGIGTSSPSAALHVTTSGAGQIRYFDGAVTGAFGSFGSGNEVFLGSGKALAFTTNGITSSETRMTIDTSGRVGIGVTSVGYNLQVAGSNPTTAINATNNSASSVGTLLYRNVDGNSNAYDVASIKGETAGNGGYGNLIFSTSFNGSLLEAFRVDTSRRLLVGTSTSRAVSDWSGNGPQGLIQIEAADSGAIMSIISAGTGDAQRAGTISLGRHRNSTVGGTPTVVQNGDALGAIVFAGGDGTDMLSNAASIRCEVDGAPGNNDMPGRIVLSTTSDGASSPTERFRISAAGALGIGGANYGSSGQVLTSNGSSAAPSWQAAGGGIEAGTVMLFVQTNAPTGWTKSTTHNNKALRVVNGTASSGGTTAFSTVFASRTPAGTVGSTTLTVSQIPSHAHEISEARYGPFFPTFVRFRPSITSQSSPNFNGNTGTDNTGGGGSHDHGFTGTAMDFNVQYVDVIIATKD